MKTKKVPERTTILETRISNLEDQFAPTQHDTQRNNQIIVALIAKTNNLENRLCWNNVCIVGVPKKSNGLQSFWLFWNLVKEHVWERDAY